jgi:MOSC domain-containing protein YiiM
VAAGKLEAIWIKRAHRGKMDSAETAALIAGKGLQGNVDRSRRRQVTILELEKWNEFARKLGVDLPSSGRRANLVVSGIGLARTRGRILRIGQVTLEIGGEVTPCERMDEVSPGLKELMKPDWGGGAFARVLSDGEVRVGDSVVIEDALTLAL